MRPQEDRGVGARGRSRSKSPKSPSDRGPERTGTERTGHTGRTRGRPPTIPTEDLLRIAREVFLERGIRATTAEVAVRAKISEGTLFHRFGSKDALFRAAMDFDPEVSPTVLTSLPSRVGLGVFAETLNAIGLELVALGRVAMPMMMMAWSNRASDAALASFVANRGPHVEATISSFRAYFAAEQARGRVASEKDPDFLARLFVGALHHYCISEVFVPADASRPRAEAFVRAVVELVVDSASPISPSPPSPRPRPRRRRP